MKTFVNSVIGTALATSVVVAATTLRYDLPFVILAAAVGVVLVAQFIKMGAEL
jgi:hypothetical protein